jgi:hypothetical protein
VASGQNFYGFLSLVAGIYYELFYCEFFIFGGLFCREL